MRSGTLKISITSHTTRYTHIKRLNANVFARKSKRKECVRRWMCDMCVWVVCVSVWVNLCAWNIFWNLECSTIPLALFASNWSDAAATACLIYDGIRYSLHIVTFAVVSLSNMCPAIRVHNPVIKMQINDENARLNVSTSTTHRRTRVSEWRRLEQNEKLQTINKAITGHDTTFIIIILCFYQTWRETNERRISFEMFDEKWMHTASFVNCFWTTNARGHKQRRRNGE